MSDVLLLTLHVPHFGPGVDADFVADELVRVLNEQREGGAEPIMVNLLPGCPQWLDTTAQEMLVKAIQIVNLGYARSGAGTLTPTYPHPSGDVIVLGPGVFVSADGSVLNWEGQNYVPQEPAPVPRDDLDRHIRDTLRARGIEVQRCDCGRWVYANDDGVCEDITMTISHECEDAEALTVDPSQRPT